MSSTVTWRWTTNNQRCRHERVFARHRRMQGYTIFRSQESQYFLQLDCYRLYCIFEYIAPSNKTFDRSVYPLAGRLKSSVSRFRNSFTEFDVVCRKQSNMPCNFCTSCCSVCLSISAACTIASNRVISAIAMSFNPVSLIARPFAASRSAVNLRFSDCSCSILEVKLVSCSGIFCSSRQFQSSKGK